MKKSEYYERKKYQWRDFKPRRSSSNVKPSIDSKSVDLKPDTSNTPSILPKGIASFKVNDFILLKLENGKTVIYVNGKEFKQCKYLMLQVPVERAGELDEIESIDEAAEKLDRSQEPVFEGKPLFKVNISPETEFWAHCSNLQAWAEYNYDTRLLHSNLAFPLLKELHDCGDPLAKSAFKEEILKRLESAYPTVLDTLCQGGYLNYLNSGEIFQACLVPEDCEAVQEIFRDVIKVRTERDLKYIPIDERDTSMGELDLNELIWQFGPTTSSSRPDFAVDKRRVIELRYNSHANVVLMKIPDALRTLTGLKYLNLRDNKIIEIPEWIDELENLEALALSRNELKALPDSIGNLKNLKTFNLDENYLKALPESIGNLEKLEILDLHNNELEKLPEMLGELMSLKMLWLSYNNLNSLPESFEKLNRLESLGLSGNLFKRIPECVYKLKSLNRLSITSYYSKTEETEIEKKFKDKGIELHLERP